MVKNTWLCSNSLEVDSISPLNTTVTLTYDDYADTGDAINYYCKHYGASNIKKHIERKVWAQYDSTIVNATTIDCGSYNFSTTGATTYTWGTIGSYLTDCKFWGEDVVPQTPQTRLQEILRQRLAPAVHTRVKEYNHFGAIQRRQITPTNDIREVRARETLCRIIGADRFRKFLKNGFVSAQAKSGKIYQIYPGHGITCVWQGSRMIERLCVYLKGNYPPTDELIMRYVMILSDESGFREKANVYDGFERKLKLFSPDNRPLTEIYQEFKKAA